MTSSWCWTRPGSALPWVPGPGLDFTPGHQFWALLPAFIAVTVVGAIETIGDGVAIQRVSRRRVAATDYRVVQGALNADGLGNLLSGIAGTLPNTTYSGTIPLVEITGMAARRVGIAIGAILLVLAFLPKATALLIAIPSPVAAAYIAVFFALLFVQGIRIVVRDGIDHRKAMVVGISFWVGLGFQNGLIYPDLIGDGFWAVLLGNAMTAGGITAVLLATTLELTSHRGRRLRLALDEEAPRKLYNFLRAFTDRLDCDPAAVNRVTAAAEETLAIMARADARGGRSPTRLTVRARQDSGNVELEFASALPCDNVEDRLARLPEAPPEPNEDEVSYRLLRHYASEVRHQKYHGLNVVTVSVSNHA